MKARMTSARLAIIGYGTLTLLVSVTVSACSGSVSYTHLTLPTILLV